MVLMLRRLRCNVLFASRMLRPVVVPSPIGCGLRGIFEERVEDGYKKLVKTGDEDLKEFIEASKNETLISTIIARFDRGDTSVLQRVQGFYADVTQVPSNLIDAQNHLIKVRKQFETLPVEVKSKFGNSFDRYVSEVSNMSISQFTEHFNLQKKVSEDEALLTKDLPGEGKSPKEDIK